MRTNKSLYLLGRLWAIGEDADPCCSRHFENFSARPHLLLAELAKHRKVRHSWKAKGLEIFGRISPDDVLAWPEYYGGGDILVGYYHQRYTQHEAVEQ